MYLLILWRIFTNRVVSGFMDEKINKLNNHMIFVNLFNWFFNIIIPQNPYLLGKLKSFTSIIFFAVISHISDGCLFSPKDGFQKSFAPLLKPLNNFARRLGKAAQVNLLFCIGIMCHQFSKSLFEVTVFMWTKSGNITKKFPKLI